MFKIGACLEGLDAMGKLIGYAAQVVFRSDDGQHWHVVSTLSDWNNASITFLGEYPRGSEVALGVVGSTGLLFVNRVATVHCPEHRNNYSAYSMAFSKNLGRTWERWADGNAQVRLMRGQFAVQPKILSLPTGEVLLSGGRPGVLEMRTVMLFCRTICDHP
jgi:hypothetical protein